MKNSGFEGCSKSIEEAGFSPTFGSEFTQLVKNSGFVGCSKGRVTPLKSTPYCVLCACWEFVNMHTLSASNFVSLASKLAQISALKMHSNIEAGQCICFIYIYVYVSVHVRIQYIPVYLWKHTSYERAFVNTYPPTERYERSFVFTQAILHLHPYSNDRSYS